MKLSLLAIAAAALFATARAGAIPTSPRPNKSQEMFVPMMATTADRAPAAASRDTYALAGARKGSGNALLHDRA
ncbi:hypothetical protein PG996_013287 [Apiospora saccharicola]|uniref:Uncharacterized protein n=1 Tax=Apiospora saccharicola TaxID=335842 RepID=A0ABR1U517_9PEZI